jgi:hypothetical protein
LKSKFWLLLLTCFSGLLLSSCSSSSSSLEEEFQELRGSTTHEARKKFVVRVSSDIGIPQQFITDLKYIYTSEDIEVLEKTGYPYSEDSLMTLGRIEVAVRTLGHEPIEFTISIFPGAFESTSIKTYEDFRSSVQHHIVGARIFNEGKVGLYPIFPTFMTSQGIMNSALVLDTVAMQAINVELANPAISEAYRISREQAYLSHYTGLWEESKVGIPPQIISEIKVRNFPTSLENDLLHLIRRFPIPFTFYITQGSIRYYLTSSELQQVIEQRFNNDPSASLPRGHIYKNRKPPPKGGGTYVRNLVTHILYIFISISTPAGRFRFVNASISFGLGSTISIKRLCVRISNCSLASLCTNGERFTVYFRIAVGRGTGPTNSHPCRSTVSIICLQELSITL